VSNDRPHPAVATSHEVHLLGSHPTCDTTHVDVPRKDQLAPDTFDRIALKTGRSRAEILECWAERSAIREYLGGLTRLEADLRAVGDTDSMLSTRTDGLRR
jgi:hypothetical protein